MIRIETNDIKQAVKTLKAGDMLLLSGEIYTARDAAHKLLCEMIERGEKLPLDINGAAIYYAGPTPERNGHIGSCGPTTSGRMDVYSPQLIRLGLGAMIGKGPRRSEVTEAMQRYGCIYLCASGGAGALIASCIESFSEVAFPFLGCESIKRLRINDMPLVVGGDVFGGTLFK